MKNNNEIYVYLGPTIRGVIQNGSIFRGSRKNILCRLSHAVSKYPQIEHLLVKDTNIAAVKAKIVHSGAYRQLMKQLNN